MKELVENSLDAGATTIGKYLLSLFVITRLTTITEIRFKNQGLDSIEVHDNGGGITPQNYETVALKHYTSKLNTYDDLGTLETFGFRGEALSSLCALSNFTVITCTADSAPKGTKLQFETSGRLKGTSVVAAQKGTTVTVEDLFKNLPVRRQELQRNIKREWQKVINVVGQYACIQTGVKITVTHLPSKGKKTTVFATRGNKTTRENIANVFGAKTLGALIPLDLRLELEPTSGPAQRWSTQEDGPSTEIRIVGHISKPVFGEGRQTPDKQMFFVNSRPCGLPQVAKVFNEVYRSFNNAQSPFIFANIELDTHGYDVNVSPDKRTIMLHEQSRMLEALRMELTSMFEAQEYSVPAASASGAKLPTYKQLTINREAPSPSAPATPGTPKPPAWETMPPPRISTRSIPAGSDAGEDVEELPPRTSGASLRERTPIDLISKWSDNHVEDWPLPKVLTDVRETSAMERAGGTTGLSKERQKLVDNFSPGQLTSADLAEDEVDTEDEEVEAPDKVPDATPQAVRDFNSHMAPLLNPHGESRESSVLPSETSHRIAPIFSKQTPAMETPIPAVPTPVIRTNSKPNSIMGRITRPRRLSDDEATITIDGREIPSSSFAGTPSKRQRVENTSPKSSPKASLFGSKLSQRFAAPGTELSGSIVDVHDDDDEDEKMGDQQDAEPTVKVEDAEGEEEGLFIDDDRDAAMAEADKQPIQDNSVEVTDDGDHAADDDPSLPYSNNDEDDEHIDERDRQIREGKKVAAMIAAAEAQAVIPTEENIKRLKSLLKPNTSSKNATVHLSQTVHTSADGIAAQLAHLESTLSHYEKNGPLKGDTESGLNSSDAEERLSLTIHKSDFAEMNIVGQFNLGFILATRTSPDETGSDDLFIIDQHASDEKYNFERLQANTVVASQRLVRPKQLALTAVEEEIVIEHKDALEANGFIVQVDEEAMVGERCQLISLPLSKEVTFELKDLEELISLLAESPPPLSLSPLDPISGQPALQRHIPRPSRVRKMFAMRACRSSVMIGKSLAKPQMAELVRNMGTIEKPWNCPHGRPTVRHLCGLGAWEKSGWEEGQRLDEERVDKKDTDWTGYVESK